MFHCLIRKRVAADTGGVTPNGDYNSKTKSSRAVKQDAADNRQVVNVHEKESTSHELQTEVAAVPLSKDQGPSDTSQPHKVRFFLYTDSARYSMIAFFKKINK